MPTTRLDKLWAAIPLTQLEMLGDAELLARFVDHQDQAAFEALLLRHAPTVRAACRTWLRAPADIDDAAQATFLVGPCHVRGRCSIGLYFEQYGG